MLDPRQLKRNAPALALLFCVLFLALSLVGYDPADSPGSAVFPPNAITKNPCGPVGAALAHVLQSVFGWASYLLILGLFVLNGLLFRGRSFPDKTSRISGFFLVLALAASAAQGLGSRLRPSPPVGPGGYLGAILTTFLGTQFGPVGMCLILAAIGLVGLAFCHDMLVVWPAQEAMRLWRNAFSGRRKHQASPEVPAMMHALGETIIDSVPARLSPPPFRPMLARPESSVPVRSTIPVYGNGTPARAQSSAPVLPIPADGSFRLPPLEILEPPPRHAVQEEASQIQSRALLLEKTLLEHGCQVRVVQIDTGPVSISTTFTLKPKSRKVFSRIFALRRTSFSCSS